VGDISHEATPEILRIKKKEKRKETKEKRKERKKKERKEKKKGTE
jgi:hypothetical protein